LSVEESDLAAFETLEYTVEDAAMVVGVARARVFAATADMVIEGDSLRFDPRVLQALRSADDVPNPIGPAWCEEGGAISRRLVALPY
jgi:hypothetical protein